MQKPDAKVVSEMEAQYPARVLKLKHRIAHSGEEIYALAVVPSRGEWVRFVEMVANPDRRPMAVEQLVRSSVKWPEAKDFDLLLDRLPGLVATLSDPIVKAAGASGEAEVGNW
jgi:hypothetical protein